MPAELGVAYCAYLVWLLAGLCDFIRHWRTDLAHTSGVPESTTHALELLLLALAILIGLAFEPGSLSMLSVLAMVVLHAIVGYVDTWFAFKRGRIVSPLEQHLHSVLDMAPPIAFAWWTISTWPAAIDGAWSFALRQPALPPLVWCAALVPAGLLCGLPAMLEFRSAWAASQHPNPARVAPLGE